MDSVNFRDLSLAEVDTKTLLHAANQQAIQRRYEDFLIVDVDGHHMETASFKEICAYIEDPVMRDQALYQGFGAGGITSATAGGGYQNLLGRVTRRTGGFANEKTPADAHRDVTLTKRWMDAIGIDQLVLFPTPMLSLGLTPRPEVEVALSRKVSATVIYNLGIPPPGQNPDDTLLVVDWRFHKRWSTDATIGDKGTTIVDLTWKLRY